MLDTHLLGSNRILFPGQVWLGHRHPLILIWFNLNPYCRRWRERLVICTDWLPHVHCASWEMTLCDNETLFEKHIFYICQKLFPHFSRGGWSILILAALVFASADFVLALWPSPEESIMSLDPRSRGNFEFQLSIQKLGQLNLCLFLERERFNLEHTL